MNLNMNQLPNINELGDMAKKIYGDLKKSLGEIFEDYKSKHPCSSSSENVKKSCAKSEDKKETVMKKTVSESKTSKTKSKSS